MLVNSKIIAVLQSAGFANGEIHVGVREGTRDIRLPGLRNTLNGRDRMNALVEDLKLENVDVISHIVETESTHDDFIGGLIVIRVPTQ